MSALQADRQLVDNCLDGGENAWGKLYQACHEPLLAAICSFLREAAEDVNLVDEIAARVWYAVVRNQAQLLSRFNVARGCRLTTFLSVIAKNEARQYFRAERRRRVREEAASRRESHPTEILIAGATEEEFVRTLTASEKRYYRTVLVAPEVESSVPDYSSENGWQLRRRVRKKLISFLNQEGQDA